MTEQELQELVDALCDEYGYEHAQVQVKPLRTAYAWCKYKSRLIVFDSHFALDNTKRTLTRVAKHEIAHLKFHSHSHLFALELKRMGMRAYKSTRGHLQVKAGQKRVYETAYWSERNKVRRY
jgi:predicted metal-dependent hydrolase